jgi:multicomponent K+:H+ antiporter subunit D
VHYVVLNLAASALFLIGVALLYGVTGTLNMADGAARAAGHRPGRRGAAAGRGAHAAGGVRLKAALLPLYLLAAGTYAAASAPVAALFAIMTKVGVYSIVRVHGVIFGADAGASALVAEPWLLPLALAPACWACWARWRRTRCRAWSPG